MSTHGPTQKGFALIELLARQPACLGVAQRRRKPWRKQAQTAFTLIELLVVIAIISLLVSILLPSLQRAQELTRTVVCRTSQKQIGLAFAMYVDDWDGFTPPMRYKKPDGSWRPNTTWDQQLTPYVGLGEHGVTATRFKEATVFVCPSDPQGPSIEIYPDIYLGTRSYTYNYHMPLRKVDEIGALAAAAEVIVATTAGVRASFDVNHCLGRPYSGIYVNGYWHDVIFDWNNYDRVIDPIETLRHNNGDGLNVLYLDSHTEYRNDQHIKTHGATSYGMRGIWLWGVDWE